MPAPACSPHGAVDPRALARRPLLIQPAVLLAGAAALLAACTKSDRPALGSVTGRVTLAGQPLAGVLVLFTPDGPGRTSQGVTDADGRYELTYLRDIKGANLGRHTVRITTPPDEAGDRMRPAPQPVGRDGHSAEVKPGSNAIDFTIPAAAPR